MSVVRGGRVSIDLRVIEDDGQLREMLSRLELQKVNISGGDLFVRNTSQMRTLATSSASIGDFGLIAKLLVATHKFLINPVSEQEGWSEILPEPMPAPRTVK